MQVVRHNISDQEELQGFLQLKEAELGAGLNHPRIVRALAHAVVIPEGVVNEQGILIRCVVRKLWGSSRGAHLAQMGLGSRAMTAAVRYPAPCRL